MPSPVYPNRAAQLRERLLAQRAPPLKPVVIDGETYYLKHPVLADRARVMELAGAAFAGGDQVKATELATDRVMAAACVLLAVDELGNPLFQATDLDVVRQAPLGSWLEQLAGEATRQLNPEPAAGKQSGGQPDDAGSSSSPTA